MVTDITMRIPADNELEKVSRQLSYSYRAAYEGMMSDEYLSSLSEDHWLPVLKESILKGGVCIIAEHEGLIAGTAVAGRADEVQHPDSAEFYAIYLSPEYIGFGVGHSLFAEMEQTMMNRGYEHCVLEVLSANERAIAFYISHGYEIINSFSVEENGMILQCETMKKRFGEKEVEDEGIV